MYIIAIAWIYVVVLMAATEKTMTAGLLTFIFYGLIPCALLLWILGRNHRHFKQHHSTTKADQETTHPRITEDAPITEDALTDHQMDEPDRPNTKTNQ